MTGTVTDYRYECARTECFLTGHAELGLLPEQIITSARGQAVVRCNQPNNVTSEMSCSFARTNAARAVRTSSLAS